MESLRDSVLVSLLFMLTSALDINKIMTVGPKMCERLCKETVDCYGFLYSTKLLSCKLQPKKTSGLDDSFKNITLRKDTDTDVDEHISTCPHFSKTFFSHSKVFQCKVYTRVRSSKRKLIEGKTNAKLLVFLPLYNAMIRQVDLNDFTIDILSIKYHTLNSIAYVPATQKYFMVASKKLYLVKALNGMFPQKIDKDVLCITVANDIIFYVKEIKAYIGSQLYRMKPNGTGKSVVKTLYKRVETIQADTKRQFLYMYVYKCLKKLTYQGKNLKTFKILAVTICLSPDAEFVYFSSKANAVYKLTISNGEKKMLVKFNGGLINTMSALGDTLFSVTKDCQLIVFEQGGSEHKTIKILNSSQCRGYLMK